MGNVQYTFRRWVPLCFLEIDIPVRAVAGLCVYVIHLIVHGIQLRALHVTQSLNNFFPGISFFALPKIEMTGRRRWQGFIQARATRQYVTQLLRIHNDYYKEIIVLGCNEGSAVL